MTIEKDALNSLDEDGMVPIEVYAASIAVSLKRIADMLEGGNAGVSVSIDEMPQGFTGENELTVYIRNGK